MKRWILTLLLVSSLMGALVSVISAAPLGQEEATPAPEEVDKERIAFPVFDPGRATYDIYLIKPDGTERQKIISDASQPAISPDGKAIVFRSWDPTNRGTFVRDLTGERIDWQFCPFPEVSRLSWASQGQFFLFHTRHEAEKESRICRSVGADMFPIRRPESFKDIYGEMPALVGDTKFVFKTCEFGKCGLFLKNIDGTPHAQLTEHPSDTAPEASPDATKIAFMSHRDGNWEIYLMNADGTELTRLTENLYSDGLPTWSPDGQMIAFASERDGVWGVWAINADGTDEHKLFDLEGPLHGIVDKRPDYDSLGWLEERISWRADVTVPAQ